MRAEPSADTRLQVAITIDVHAGDSPTDVVVACEWLRERGIASTFFVPADLVRRKKFKGALRAIPDCGHEAANHSLQHDSYEHRALSLGEVADLGFLSEGKAIHEDYFNTSPISFRSIGWARLGAATVQQLHTLGFRVDSSATPQRLSLLSSTPFSDTWTWFPRRVHELMPGLLEVPTTSFLLPAGSTTFAILRGATNAFLAPLKWEAIKRPARVLTLQFHPDEFNAASARVVRRHRLRPADFVPRAGRGFTFRHALRDRNPRSVVARKDAIVGAMTGATFQTLESVASLHFDGIATRALARTAS